VMKAFNTNCSKCYVGKRVNLHLKDGTVLINVLIAAIEDKRFVRCTCASRRNQLVSLRDVSYVQDVPMLLLEGL